jgi:hypothetical protein
VFLAKDFLAKYLATLRYDLSVFDRFIGSPSI